MNCSRVQSFFDRMYREGDAFDLPDVTAHVRQCSRCGREYEQWCGIARKLGDEPALDAPPVLYGKVIRELEVLRAGTSRTWWFPLQWRLLPYGPVYAVMLLIAAISLFVTMPRIAKRQLPAVSAEKAEIAPEVMVHFEISLSDARQVALVGDFNDWNVDTNLLTRTETDTWKIDLPIPKGSYQYLFLIDGTHWKTDPGRTESVPDGFGGFNTVIDL